jgi:hypothetical protein
MDYSQEQRQLLVKTKLSNGSCSLKQNSATAVARKQKQRIALPVKTKG